MIIEALIIALAIGLAVVFYTKSLRQYNVKPRIALAQFTVLGKTEESEQVHIATTIFKDESHEEVKAKLDAMYKIREDRMQYQNERMIELQDQIRKDAIKEKERIESEGGHVSDVTSLDRKVK